MGHAMTENRNGLVVQTSFTQATGTAERDEAKAMIQRHSPGSTRQLTVGADKAYDTADFVADLRAMCVTPHVTQKAERLGHRQPHHAARGLCREPTPAQACRGTIRLVQDHWRPRASKIKGRSASGLLLYHHHGCLRSRPIAQALWSAGRVSAEERTNPLRIRDQTSPARRDSSSLDPISTAC